MVNFLKRATLVTASASPSKFPRPTRFTPCFANVACNSPVPLPRVEPTDASDMLSRSVGFIWIVCFFCHWARCENDGWHQVIVLFTFDCRWIKTLTIWISLAFTAPTINWPVSWGRLKKAPSRCLSVLAKVATTSTWTCIHPITKRKSIAPCLRPSPESIRLLISNASKQVYQEMICR